MFASFVFFFVAIKDKKSKKLTKRVKIKEVKNVQIQVNFNEIFGENIIYGDIKSD